MAFTFVNNHGLLPHCHLISMHHNRITTTMWILEISQISHFEWPTVYTNLYSNQLCEDFSLKGYLFISFVVTNHKKKSFNKFCGTLGRHPIYSTPGTNGVFAYNLESYYKCTIYVNLIINTWEWLFSYIEGCNLFIHACWCYVWTEAYHPHKMSPAAALVLRECAVQWINFN